MEITCPHCSSKFNLPEKFGKPGAKLRCSVCKTVFQLPGKPSGGGAAARDTGKRLPDMAPRSKKRAWLWWLSGLVLLLAIGGTAYYYLFMGESREQVKEEDVAKKVELLTMRNVRQYNVLNEKVGKVFVIEGKVVNEFPMPKDLIELEGAIYDRDRKPLAVKTQLAGTQLSLFQLQVLSEKEMESFLNNKIEILSNNTNVPPGGEVPFMILFYGAPDNVAEFGVKIVDVKEPRG